jgi:hypothetical protein
MEISEAHGLNLHFGVLDTGSWRSQESRLFIIRIPKLQNAKRQNPEIGTSNHNLISIMEFQILGVGGVKSRDSSSQESPSYEMRNTEILKQAHQQRLHFSVSGIATWSVEISHHRNAEMSECKNVKNTFWCRFRIPGVGVSKQFTIGIPKCQNAEMQKTPFGAGFRYWELEVSKHFTTGMPKCWNVGM